MRIERKAVPAFSMFNWFCSQSHLLFPLFGLFVPFVSDLVGTCFQLLGSWLFFGAVMWDFY